MSSPIFDSTFGTGRFRREELMTTSDQSQTAAAIRAALAQSNAISRSGEREKSPLITDVQEHRDAAYQNGWDDGYAEGYGKAHALAQSDAGPDRSVHGELIPDCPTEGVAARQGNGG